MNDELEMLGFIQTVYIYNYFKISFIIIFVDVFNFVQNVIKICHSLTDPLMTRLISLLYVQSRSLG